MGFARRRAGGTEIDTLGTGDRHVRTLGTDTLGPTVTPLGGAGGRTVTAGTGSGRRGSRSADAGTLAHTANKAAASSRGARLTATITFPRRSA
ncbi:hypothetical protein GCM10022419_085920 [Nonomuraea rosea]|uniref:Uncharacterized protein n=1 Tax=Nonomuraea rosea TaxID=638574 RepID=A0ABP6YSH9_9ACTN